jgi:hypothetical protein
MNNTQDIERSTHASSNERSTHASSNERSTHASSNERSYYYSQIEKVQIVIDIVKKLKNYTNEHGIVVDLYNNSFSYVPKFKKICNDYIHSTEDFSGSLEFLEIDKKIKYFLPIKRKNKAFFTIKIK